MITGSRHGTGMPIRNDVLRYAGPRSGALRILWIDPGRTRSYIFAPGVAGVAVWPVHTPLRTLEADTATGARVIHALSAAGGALFDVQARRRMVAQVAAAHGVSAATPRRYLRRYWDGRQTQDTRWPKQAATPRDVGAGPARRTRRGVLQSEPDRRSTFRMGATRHASTHEAFSRRAAYRQMPQEFNPGRTIDALPTFGQFNYWIDKDGVLSSI